MARVPDRPSADSSEELTLTIGMGDDSQSGDLARMVRLTTGRDLVEVFFEQREVLAHLRDFARARRCSPWSVLGVALTRVVAATPPAVVLPPLVGSHLSLNLFVVLMGSPGAGKDAAIGAGDDALALRGGVEFHSVGLGSGEGLLDQYVRMRPPNPKQNDPGGLEQHNESVLFVNPEIETVAALRSRSSATLMPELRSAWMGKGLGFAYANRERRLHVVKHAYRLCLILGAQPANTGMLLDDAGSGTPQRFLWLPANDPEAPDEAPDEPTSREWRPPVWPPQIGGAYSVIPVCDDAAAAIDAARTERLRGNGGGSDGHALACREKVAAALAILDGRADVDQEDWSLAGIVMVVSDETRRAAGADVAAERRSANLARGEAEGVRTVVAADVVDANAVRRVSHRLLSRLVGRGWVAGAELRRLLNSLDRGYFAQAVEALTAGDWIEVTEAEYHGQAARQYRATIDSVPSRW